MTAQQMRCAIREVRERLIGQQPWESAADRRELRALYRQLNDWLPDGALEVKLNTRGDVIDCRERRNYGCE